MFYNLLNPSLIGTPGAGKNKGFGQDILDSGIEFGGYYQGAPGVGTFSSEGRYLAPGTDERLPTVLPGYEALAQYNTLFGQYDAGTLSESQSALINAGLGAIGGSGEFGSSLASRYGGASLGGGGGGVPAPPDFANRTLDVDNIGGLVGDIFDDMPPEFQQFTLNMLNTADPTTVEQQVGEFVDYVQELTQMQVESTSRAALDVYAAEGLASSGAAIAGMMDIATRATVESSARVSEYALTRYDQLIAQQGIAQGLAEHYLNAGAAEQANRVEFERAKLQAEATAYGSYAVAQAQVQQQLIAANARIQESLIGAEVQARGQDLDFLNSQIGMMYQENDRANQQNTMALLQPYQGLYNMQGQTNMTNPSPGFGIGGLGTLAGGVGGLLEGIAA
jgi:hypothetical protein